MNFQLDKYTCYVLVKARAYDSKRCDGDDGGGPQWTKWAICKQVDSDGEERGRGVCGITDRYDNRYAILDNKGLTDIKLTCCPDIHCKCVFDYCLNSV